MRDGGAGDENPERNCVSRSTARSLPRHSSRFYGSTDIRGNRLDSTGGTTVFRDLRPAAVTENVRPNMTTRLIAATIALFVACSPTQDPIAAGAQSAPLPTGTLDQLLAPIALYPDALLAQMLMSATDAAEDHRARQVAEGEPDAERHGASGRRGQGRVRCELRGVDALPSSRGENGGPDRVDEGPRAGVHLR